MATGTINIDGRGDTIDNIYSKVNSIDKTIVVGMNDINDKIVSYNNTLSSKLNTVESYSRKNNIMVNIKDLPLAGVGQVDLANGFKMSDGPYLISPNSSAVSYHGRLHVFEDGYASNENYRHHYVWDGISWESIEEVPIQCVSNAVIYNDRIHIIGKHTTDQSTGSVAIHYSWGDDGWRQESSLPCMTLSSLLASYNGYLHICSTFVNGEGRKPNHYRYNGSYWMKVQDLPWYTEYKSVCVYNNRIHAISQSMEHYTWDGNAWSKVGDLPSYKREYTRSYIWSHALVTYDNKLYLIRSGDPDASYGDVCFVWVQSYWQPLKRLPFNISINTCFADYNHELHIITSSGPVWHYVCNTKAYKIFLRAGSIVICETGSFLYWSDRINIVNYNIHDGVVEIPITTTGLYYIVTKSNFYINT